MARVLMVCWGNICRSAMAEQVIGDAVRAEGVPVTVTSAGVSPEETGSGVDARAVRALAARGYSTGVGHRAHQVTDDELARQDLVLAMTNIHRIMLLDQAVQAGIPLLEGEAARQARERGEKVVELRMFQEFSPQWVQRTAAVPEATKRGELDVPDPWYGDMSDFAETLRTIEDARSSLLDYLRSHVIR